MNLTTFRKNLRKELQKQNISLGTLSCKSNLSEDTLRSIIYGKSQDIRLSTMLKIADVLNCSLDSLIDRTIYSPAVDKLIKQLIILPETSLRAISLNITLEQKSMLKCSKKSKLLLPIFIPNGNFSDGMYYNGNIYEHLDITDYPETLKDACDYGMKISTKYFEPTYIVNDILLISSKTHPIKGDIVVSINNEGKIFIRKYTD
ncbi:MAG: helix-turn-helix transcriptional regulator, partial [Lachnospiraceae bacterium]|nr:helix-turn-helix transcriptional regulator [Lachnospiraceae bacterium]